MSRPSATDYWGVGTAIGLCAAVGVVLGALLGDVVLWLCVGAAVGVVIGAITAVRQTQPRPRQRARADDRSPDD